LLLLLSSIIATAQSFKFNYLIKYISKHEGKPDFEYVIYTNSKNDAYYFRVLKDKKNPINETSAERMFTIDPELDSTAAEVLNEKERVLIKIPKKRI
jgi:hypothetical protein